MTSSHARSLTAVLVAAILALMAAACGSPGSSNGGSAASGAGIDQLRHVEEGHDHDVGHRELTGAVEGVERAHLAVRAEVPERDGQAHGQELRRLHDDHQARRLVRQRARRLPGQRGIGRPGAGEGAPDRAARLAGEGLRLGQPLRQLGRAEPAALVGRRPALGHRRSVGRRPEGGGAGRLLQQGHHEAARHQGADHVRRVRAEPGDGQGRRRAADHGRQPRPLADGPRLHGAAVALRRPHRDRATGRTAGRRHLRRRRHPQGSHDARSSGATRATSRTTSTASARPPPPPASARARGSTSSPAPGRTRPSPARSSDGVGFFPLPVRGRQRGRPHHGLAVAAVPHQRQVPEHRRWRRPSSTSSPTRTRPAS